MTDVVEQGDNRTLEMWFNADWTAFNEKIFTKNPLTAQKASQGF